MQNRLFVGNLPFRVTELDLRDEFGKCGTLKDVKIITNRETGQSRGFGFIEFAAEAEAQAAIQALDGQDFGGRQIVVKIAESRPQRSGGGRYNSGGNGNGGGRKFSPPRDSGGGGRNDRGRDGSRDRGRKRRRDHDYDDYG